MYLQVHIQSPVGIEINVVTSVVEPKSLNSSKTAEKPFGALFAGMVGKAAKQDSQGMAVKNGKEGKPDTNNAISKDEVNSAVDGKSSVSGLKDPEQGIKSELVGMLEELLKRLNPDTEPAADVLKSESNPTQAMHVIQAVINDFKQVPVEKDALQNLKAELLNSKAASPVSVPDLLQNIKETLAKIDAGNGTRQREKTCFVAE